MTPNKEDYLKCIYEIGIDLHKITNKEIAARMQVSPPAVTEMIKRMKSENLILKEQGIWLSINWPRTQTGLWALS